MLLVISRNGCRTSQPHTFQPQVSTLDFSTPDNYTEVHFASFLYGGFTAMAAIAVNPPERQLAKRTSVHYGDENFMVEKSGIKKFRVEMSCANY